MEVTRQRLMSPQAARRDIGAVAQDVLGGRFTKVMMGLTSRNEGAFNTARNSVVKDHKPSVSFEQMPKLKVMGGRDYARQAAETHNANRQTNNRTIQPTVSSSTPRVRPINTNLFSNPNLTLNTVPSPREHNHTTLNSTKNINLDTLIAPQASPRRPRVNQILERSEKVMTKIQEKPILGGFMSHFSNAKEEKLDQKWAFGVKFSRQEPAQTKFLVGMNERTQHFRNNYYSPSPARKHPQYEFDKHANLAELPEADNEVFAHTFTQQRLDEFKRDPSPANTKKNIPTVKEFRNLRQMKAREQFGFLTERTNKKKSHADKKGDIPRYPFSMERGLKLEKKEEADHQSGLTWAGEFHPNKTTFNIPRDHNKIWANHRFRAPYEAHRL